jgi:3-oxoacyl-[acyl-carrier protein] reductase
MKQRRIAVVTGGTRGIGRAVSERLARAGMDVAMNYRRDDEAATGAIRQLADAGVAVRAFRADVSTWSGAQELVGAVTDELGPVSVLVHNAGRASAGRYVADTDPDEVMRLLTVHAVAAHWLAKLVIPGMRAMPRGDLVFVSSAATMGMRAGGGAYTMAKAAMEALAQTLDREEAPHGIRVNVVAPGLADTEMGRRTARARNSSLEAIGEGQPFGRVCAPEDVAELIAFLVSPAAEFITGQRIYLHGGVYGRP